MRLTDILHSAASKIIGRAYSRDIGKLSGTYQVQVTPTGEYDHYDNRLGYVEVKTTPFPKAVLNLPSTGTANTPVSITYSGEEFYPSGVYGVNPFIKAEVKVNGTTIKTGQGNLMTQRVIKREMRH